MSHAAPAATMSSAQPTSADPLRSLNMDWGRLAVALVVAGITLTVIVWAVLAVLAAKLFL
jgi:hypothetical protein